jgi:protein-L-isoaspartate(D-aspartate) O-methyltransferase
VKKMEEDPYTEERKEMVRRQIAARGIDDERVLRAMENVPRHIFVPENMRRSAYEDSPLPIGRGQTISQPYIVALMTSLLELKPGDYVLEIGGGCGYQAAVIAKIAEKVLTTERIPELSEFASENLKKLDIKNIEIITCDGTDIKDKGKFDAIIITAASPCMPEYLYPLLKEGGRLVAPVGDINIQTLVKVKIIRGKPEISYHGGVRFVPLIGKHGFS